jgi:hypothetical protein
LISTGTPVLPNGYFSPAGHSAPGFFSRHLAREQPAEKLLWDDMDALGRAWPAGKRGFERLSQRHVITMMTAGFFGVGFS